jgi:hypothetical protein
MIKICEVTRSVTLKSNFNLRQQQIKYIKEHVVYKGHISKLRRSQ